jgi:CHAD domain-containing protein
VTLEQLVDKSWELIREKAGIIHKLEIDTADSETIHKVRKHLKAMSAVASLSSALHSDERLDSILTDMRRAEELIGEWHDRSVLLDFMNKFLHRMEKKKGADTKALLIFRDSVQEEAHSLLKQIIPEVHSVLNFIRATLESPE